LIPQPSFHFDFSLQADPRRMFSTHLNIPKPNPRPTLLSFGISMLMMIFVHTCNCASWKYTKWRIGLCGMCRNLGRHEKTLTHWSNNRRVYSSMSQHSSNLLLTKMDYPSKATGCHDSTQRCWSSLWSGAVWGSKVWILWMSCWCHHISSSASHGDWARTAPVATN